MQFAGAILHKNTAIRRYNQRRRVLAIEYLWLFYLVCVLFSGITFHKG
jgi:hypothetical protein